MTKVLKTTWLKKFKFANIQLAKKVRGNMLAILTQFDMDKNKKFDDSQIRAALSAILGQDDSQLTYATKNVFRYDRDNDGSVTYPQLQNFCVEQHFGEIAIQRLHKKGYYVNGSRRIMNIQQFQSTLNNCFSYINTTATHQQYQQLFNQIDLDHDGMISYEDYFIFLREYFGSQSDAADLQQNDDDGQHDEKPDQSFDGNGENPKQRFAKLIYTQFKITVMEKDRNKNLLLQRDQVEDILSNVLRISYTDHGQIQQKLLGNSNSLKYEQFMRSIVTNYFSSIGLQKYLTNRIVSQTDFVELCQKLSHFVSIKPSQSLLKACYRSQSKGSKSISSSQVSSLMRKIFQNFQFDVRGLSSSRTKNSVPQQNTYKFY